MAQEVSKEPEGDVVGLGMALWIYFGFLIIALLLTVIINGVYRRNQLAFVAPFSFPLGFLMAFTPEEGVNASDTLTFVGYVVYVVLLGLFIKVRRRPIFYAVVILYIVTLLINVAGCTQREYSFKMNCSNGKSAPVAIVQFDGAS